jgi:hypothetical protein
VRRECGLGAVDVLATRRVLVVEDDDAFLLRVELCCRGDLQGDLWSALDGLRG